MLPRLVLLSGPRAGQTFSLGAEVFSIGRHSENALRVLDPAASRQHCRVEPVDGGFVLRDLGNRQGTFVNSRPVREHRLEEEGLVTVGETLLLFRTQEGETVEAEPRLLTEEDSFTARTTIQRLPGRPPEEGLESRDFQVLLRVAAALQSPRSTAELAQSLLEQVLAAGPGDRAALLPVLESAPAAEAHLGHFHEVVQETKKQLIRTAVAEAQGNITRAAARLGLQPTYLHRLIRNLDLRREIER